MHLLVKFRSCGYKNLDFMTKSLFVVLLRSSHYFWLASKASISSHFKSVPVITMTWQLIWNGPWENDRAKAELVDMYELAKLRLAKPKLYILNKIQYTFWATAISLFFLFLWTLISPKTELISAIISLSKLVRFLSPASNNLKGKDIHSINKYFVGTLILLLNCRDIYK